MMRRINEIIIHCTASPEGRPHTVKDIDNWHIDRGFNGIGYHFLIGLEGEVWKGRPIEKMGAHTIGHNEYSVGICYVGGLDSEGRPKDTRTKLQKDALLKLVKELKLTYTDASVHGHYEYANKACPCFNVAQWVTANGL